MILAGESFRLGEKMEKEEETIAAAGELRVSMGDAMRLLGDPMEKDWLFTTWLDLQHKFSVSSL